jgi:hypothetical protein
MVPASAAISATLRQQWTAVLTMSRPRFFCCSAFGRYWHKADLARRLPLCPLSGAKWTSKAFMCRQRNSDDAFRLEAPELAPAVPKMPTLLDGAERAGKTNISKYETRSSESAGLELTSYGVTTRFLGHYD